MRVSHAFPLLILVTLASACGNENKQTEDSALSQTEPRPGSILSRLEADGNFTSLLAALASTGLEQQLREGGGDFTLFAPTDDAFAAAREGLQYRGARITEGGPKRVHPLPTDRDSLIQALQNHIVSGKLYAADLARLREGKTVNGMTISFDIEGDVAALRSRPSNAMRRPTDMFMVNLGPAGSFSQKEYESNLIRTDIEASNGIIHVIDAVLLHPYDRMKPKGQ